MLIQDATDWDVRPRAGWNEFRQARQRVADLMRMDSEIHNITVAVQRSLGGTEDVVPTCQLCDATD